MWSKFSNSIKLKEDRKKWKQWNVKFISIFPSIDLELPETVEQL